MKKISFFLWATFLLSLPGDSFAQVTVTPTRTAVYPSLPTGYVPYVSTGVGADMTSSYFDQDEVETANMLVNHAPNFASRAATDVILVTAGGTTTFTENDTYGTLNANWASGAEYHVWTAAHIATTRSGTGVASVTCSPCGYAYTPGSTVAVSFSPPSSGGTPAVATFTANSNGQLISPGTVTTAGSGYSFNPIATTPWMIGRSGTISSNLAKDGSNNIVYTVSDAATAYNSFVPGDYVMIQQQAIPAPNSYATASNDGGISLSGAATATYETSDLPANTDSQQALLLTTGTGSASTNFVNDAGRRVYLKLNGSYSACLTYKIVSGSAPSVGYTVVRRNSYAGTNNTLMSGSIVTATGGWQTTCATGTAAETAASPTGTLTITFNYPSSATMYIQNQYFGESSTQLESANVPANSYVSDAFIDSYLALIGGAGQVGGYFTSRGWYGTESTPVRSMMVGVQATYQTNVARVGSANFSGGLQLSWPAQLFMDKVLQTRSGKQGIPNIVLPTVMTTADAALVTQYFYGGCGTTGGAFRCHEGQTAPWVGPGGVFPYIKFTLGNENWNYNSFTGQAIVYSSYITPDTYSMAGYGAIAQTIFAAMQADSSYASGYADFALTTQLGTSNDQGMKAEAMCSLCTEFEDAPYTGQGGGTYSTSTATAALLSESFTDYHVSGRALYGDVTTNVYSQLPRALKCSYYEYGMNTLQSNGFVSVPYQNDENQFVDGLQAGVSVGDIYAEGENAGCYGTKVIFRYGQVHQRGTPSADGLNYGEGAGYTASGIWGIINDIEGEGTVRPAYLVNQIINKSVIGTPVTATVSGNPTYNLTTTPSSSWVPNTNNIPCLVIKNEYNGTNASLHVLNRCTSTYTVTLAGAYAPTGAITTYSMTSPNETDNNESVAIAACTNTGGTTTCVTANSEGFPLKTGDTAYMRQTSSSSCNGAFGPVTVSAVGTFTYSGSGACTGGFVGNSPNAITMVTNSSASNPISVPPGNTTAIYSTGTPTAAAPTFSPVAGTYSSTQTVSLASTTPSNTITYCIGVSCTPGTTYSGPLTVSTSESISAYATASGYTQSSTSTAVYTITSPAATPVITPAAGAYTSQQTIAISDSTSGASIYYTTDGSTPTTSSTLYTGTFLATYAETVKAIAVASGYSNSTVASNAYTFSTGTTATTVTATHPSVPTYQGQSVTSTITLGNSNATGAVQVYNGSTLLGTVTIPNGASGVGTWTGSYTWNANNLNYVYQGDVNYAAHSAVYDGVLVRLNKTNLVLKSSNTNVTQGTSVTFTATIASLTDGTTPSGTITFYEKGVALGGAAVTLSGGVATYSTSSLGVGEHYIQAVYAGDRSNDDQSQSLWLDETVRPTTAVPCQINYSGSLSGYTVYYVSNSGSDSNAGTCASPFLTIAHATSLVSGGGFAILGQAGGFFKETGKMPAGTSGSPNVLDSYGTGPYPTFEEADTPSLTWSAVSGAAGTYQATYSGYPYKAFVDSVGQDSTPVLPTFNYIGNCGSAAANPYDTCLNTGNGATYTRILASAGGAFNANNQSWSIIPALPSTMQTTGLANVEANPNTLWANGTLLYMHLADGSSPGGHTIQLTTRFYGDDQSNTSNVIVNHWNAAHMGGTGFLNKATTSGATNGNVKFLADNAYNCSSTYGYDYPNRGDFFTGCFEVNSSEIAGDTTSNVGAVLGPGLHFGSVDSWYGLNTNIQGIGVHGAAGIVATGISGGTVNAEDFDFGQDSFAAAANSNVVVGGYTGSHPTQADALAVVLTGGQSGIRVSNVTTGTFTNVIVHDSLGFGDQCGGSSTNVTESYFLEYNLRATTGRQDWVTDSVPGGGGSLFNAGDGNGGCTNLVKTHVTSYNVSAAWQTLENGSPYATNATLKYSIGDNSHGVRPDNTILTTGNSTNGDYLLLNRFESQPQASGSWTGNWFIPNALQTNAFNWSNSSDGDHATAFVQMDVNTGGTGNIFSTTSPFVNPAIGNFALTAGTPGIGQSGDASGANPGYDQTSGTATACGTPSAVAVAEAYPNQTQFGFNTVAVGHYAAFKAVATCADGSQRSIAPGSVTWAASAPSSASIASTTVTTPSPIRGATAANGTFGLLTGLVCCGASNVTASYGGVTSSPYAMTVTAGTPIPTATPATGTYSSTQNVTLASTDSSAQIYYTLDGSTPTTSSTLYSAPIAISAATTINAIGYNSTGPYTSAVGSFPYTITVTPQAVAPSFTPTGGSYASTQSVTLASPTTGAVIKYCVTTSPPCTPTTTYSSAILVSVSESIYAFTTASGYTQSTTSSAAYSITIPQAATPTFTPVAGSYSVGVTVTLVDTTTGAIVYYTLDGSTPTTSSTRYTVPIAVTASKTIKAIATAPGFSQSAVGSAAYAITSGLTCVPVSGGINLHVALTASGVVTVACQQ